MKKTILVLFALLVSAKAYAWPPQTILASQNGLLGFQGMSGANNEYFVVDLESVADQATVFSVSGIRRFYFEDIGVRAKDFRVDEKLPLLTGLQEYSVVRFSLENQDHTGGANFLYGIKFDDMTLKAGAYGRAIAIGQGWHEGLNLATNLPIVFDAADPVQIYHDGTILNIYFPHVPPKVGELKIWGDVSFDDNGLKEFDRMAIKNDDLTFGSCDKDQIRIDTGGSVRELCYCDGSNWLCTPLRAGPQD